jgi:predicted nucleic acid-binding protein
LKIYRFVLDTCILIKAFDIQAAHFSLDCFSLAGAFHSESNLGIVLDFEEKISGEYRKKLQDNKAYQKWLNAMYYSKKITYQSCRLDEKIRKKLEELGFHEVTDQTFVAVALNSDKNIVSEDSDYGKGNEARAKSPEKQAVLKYMTESLGLKVMDSIEGLNFIRKTGI